MPLLREKPLKKGQYVLATKFSDGHCGDPWAVGFIVECDFSQTHPYLVTYTYKGVWCKRRYRRAQPISATHGAWLMENALALEAQHPYACVYRRFAGREKLQKPLVIKDANE